MRDNAILLGLVVLLLVMIGLSRSCKVKKVDTTPTYDEVEDKKSEIIKEIDEEAKKRIDDSINLDDAMRVLRWK